jgi:hypothetical protein
VWWCYSGLRERPSDNSIGRNYLACADRDDTEAFVTLLLLFLPLSRTEA